MQPYSWVAVAELIFYIPTCFIALYVCFRHSFRRSSGWIYTLLLCQVRVAGAICELVLSNQSTPASGLIEATIILDSIGISPLLIATLGLVSRFFDFVKVTAHTPFSTKHVRLLQIFVAIGLILSIVGGVSTNTSLSNGVPEPPTTSKVGIIFYIIAYVFMTFIFFVLVFKIQNVPSKERRIPIAVALALPFVLVRLVYAACRVFANDATFNVLGGSVAANVCMAVAPEMIVVGFFLTTGLLVDRLGPGQEAVSAKGDGSMTGVGLTERPSIPGDVEAEAGGRGTLGFSMDVRD